MTDRELMQQALEALETVIADVKTTPNAYEALRQAITALRERLAQPEQEPGAIYGVGIEVGEFIPPRREWVGLTDEDRVELWADSANVAGFGGMKFEHIRAVEAKLKEKNT